METSSYISIAQIITDYIKEKHKAIFLFGNIAFKDKLNVNIGNSLYFGNTICRKTKLQNKLNTINNSFSKDLNNYSAFSMTDYLIKNKIVSFHITFSKIKDYSYKICFNPIHDFFNGKNSPSKNSPQYAEIMIENEFNDENISSINKELNFTDERFFSGITKTLNYYLKFYIAFKIQKGDIYLIRPSVTTQIYDGLSYMFLKDKISNDDEIILSLLMSSYFTVSSIKKVEVESIKSALATVIARNLSHNLGSHVLVKVVN